MNKIDTIERISDTLGKSTIAIEPKRCTYIRNWNSKCRACLLMCPHDAILRSLGHLEIDTDLCTDCGACTSACPAGAMMTTAPSMQALVKQARELAKRSDGTVRFVCAQHAEQTNVDPMQVVILPCLDYLDEYLITGLFAVGAKRVVLMRESCEDCEVNCNDPYIDQVVPSTRKLLELWRVDTRIEETDVPEKLRRANKTRAHATGQDRRDAFTQAGGSMAGFLMRAVDDIVGGITGEEPQREDSKRQVVVRPDEKFDASTYRSARMLAMLDRLGSRPYGATIESRFWASVDVDSSKCKICGGCAKMCATDALHFEEDEYGKCTLTFRPSLCMACGLCKDSCLTHSMVYSNKVLADDLDANVVKTLFENAEPQKANKFF